MSIHAIYLEVGEKKTFACSLQWPGWCRSGKTETEAVQALVDTAPRYRNIAQRAGLMFEPGTPAIVERVPGNATTNFGAPAIIVAADRQPSDTATAERGVALLRAAWEIMDEVIAASQPTLRKGPRGGGRERDEIARHVIEAERAYARKIGVRQQPFTIDDLITRSALREEIADVLRKPSNGSALTAGNGWTAAYAIRRITWHVIDHIWEIEDRQL
jgi:hypothetical protein